MEVQTQTFQLDESSSLTVKYEITLGDALVSLLLMFALSLWILKWGHSLIWRKR